MVVLHFFSEVGWTMRIVQAVPSKGPCCTCCFWVPHTQAIQGDGSWAEAAALAMVNGDEGRAGGQEARLDQLLQRTQR